MITDLELLIEASKQELHDREYHAHLANKIATEWEAIYKWFQQHEFTEFNQDVGYQYCDEVIGSHIIVEGMSATQKRQLRAARMLISYQENGDFEFRSPRIERTFPNETGRLMMEFFQDERALGRSERTISNRELYLYFFNAYLIREGLGFNDLSVDIIEDFFTSMGYELSSRHNCANHLRQLFHYLYDHGYTIRDNAIFVLKDQYRNQHDIPTTYTEEEISKVLASIDRTSAIGKRDYLILLLAAEYGWRTGDIINFKFSQIDWDRNIISFDQAKTDVPVEFPLLASVGNAIIDSLKYGRPQTDVPEIIVAAKGSNRGSPLKAPTVHSVVSRYMREANIPNWEDKRHGAHSLRHSLASNMLKKNVSMPVISTVLGHQRTETTKIYLKIDFEQLILCPLPMPKLSTVYYKEVGTE